MSREFQPGDVAMVSDPVHGNLVMVHIGHDPGGRCWHGALGNGDLRCLAAEQALDARPLVVINPEDTKQVERLDALYQSALDTAPKFDGLADVMRAALREFADPKPPKPPCGVRLAVTYSDGDGTEWTCSQPHGHDGPHSAGTFVWTAHYGEAAS